MARAPNAAKVWDQADRKYDAGLKLIQESHQLRTQFRTMNAGPPAVGPPAAGAAAKAKSPRAQKARSGTRARAGTGTT